MAEPGMELVVPGVGEVVQLDNPREVALALAAVRDLEYQLKAAKTDLTRALVFASKAAGTKTLHLDGVKAVVKGSTETLYDAEAIEEGLREAGMAESRIREIVKETVSYTVSAAQAQQAEGANPAYAEVIAAHRTVVDKNPSVTISKGKS